MKQRCVEAKLNGNTDRIIFDRMFYPEYSNMSFATFSRALRKWKNKALADTKTLSCGTYPNMIPHDATVQVNGSGEIVQAWIKQRSDEEEWNSIAEMLTKDIPPVQIEQTEHSKKRMLEIPLFDMHFGVASLSDYKDICKEVFSIVKSNEWDEINIIVGQDLLHNNDFRGHTAKGTPIEQVDFAQAWDDAWVFWNIIIRACIESSNTVWVRYSKGNHDECSSWCFVECLKAKFPQVNVDDAIKARKAFVWNGCFIGYGHCEYQKSPDKLFRDFVLDFPDEFSKAKVREIHTGHLHSEATDNGLIVRRLSSAVPTDEWSSNNGFIGSHKRFQLFEYAENRLLSIHYI